MARYVSRPAVAGDRSGHRRVQTVRWSHSGVAVIPYLFPAVTSQIADSQAGKRDGGMNPSLRMGSAA